MRKKKCINFLHQFLVDLFIWVYLLKLVNENNIFKCFRRRYENIHPLDFFGEYLSDQPADVQTDNYLETPFSLPGYPLKNESSRTKSGRKKGRKSSQSMVNQSASTRRKQVKNVRIQTKGRFRIKSKVGEIMVIIFFSSSRFRCSHRHLSPANCAYLSVFSSSWSCFSNLPLSHSLSSCQFDFLAINS